MSSPGTPLFSDKTPMPGGAAAGSPPQDVVPTNGIEFDPRIQLGRTGLKQYGGFVFEDFQRTLRGKEGAKAYREVVDNSPLVGGILRLLTLTLRQVNKLVEPFSDDAEDQKRAERVDQALDDMSVSWPDLMAEITTMLAYGYAPMEIVWKKCDGFNDDGTSRYDDGLIMPRKIFLMAQDTLFRWNFDEDGGVRAMIQLAPPDYVMRTIPIEKMLLFRPHIEKGNPEGTSLLRSGYFSWVMIKRLVEFEAISGERDAGGIPVAKIPAVNMLTGATAGQLAVFNKFKTLVQNLRIDDQAGIVIPSDCWPDTKMPMFDVQLLGVTGRAQHFDFGSVITRHEVRLAMSMLADIMLLGHDKVGSFSLSHDKRSMLADALGAWLDAIVGVFNRHLFPRIYAYNGWPMDRMCKLTHGGVQDDDLAALADAIQKLSQAGMPLFPDMTLENHIREEMGWPERTEDDELAQYQDEQDQIAEQGRAMMQARLQQGPPGKPGAVPPGGGKTPPPLPGKKAIQKFRSQPRTRRGVYGQRTGTVMTALQLLSDRARVGHGDDVHHGFHVADPPPYDARQVTKDAIEAAPIERVQMKDLTATQPTVRRDHVRRFLENPGLVVPGQRTLSGHLEDRAVVVRAGGKDYIHDGHKRLASRVLLGYEDALVRVLELEPHVADNQDPTVTTSLASNTGKPRAAGTPGEEQRPAPSYDPNTALAKAGMDALTAAAEAIRTSARQSTHNSAAAGQPGLSPAAETALASIDAATSAISEAIKVISEKDTTVEIHNPPAETVIHFEPTIEGPTIQPAPVHVETKPADTVVNVAAPNVTVEAAKLPEQAPTMQEVVRDKHGQIAGVIKRPLRESDIPDSRENE